MADPKLVPGTLYINRDRDYLTGEWGPYVKIGIVRDEREANARVREHQTGNPREVVSIFEFKAPMVEALETQLHHRFAEHWTSGEWFHMDEELVNHTLVPEIRTLVAQQTMTVDSFEEKARLKNLQSNGIRREATAEEAKLFEELKVAEEVYARAKLEREIADLALRKLAGNSGGIEGVLTLLERRISASFDKKGFEKAHPELWSKYQRSTVTKPKGTLRFAARVSLAKLVPDKVALKKSLGAALPTLQSAQSAKPSLNRTTEMSVAHDAFVRTLGPLAREWAVDRLKAILAHRLGFAEAIEGVCTWKREVETKLDFDETRFRNECPDHYARFLKPATKGISVKINFHRPYDAQLS